MIFQYDVIIAGAGPAGFAAAIGAAALNKKVLLLDKNSGPGGVSVFCGCPVFSGISGFSVQNNSGVVGIFASAMADHAFIQHNNTLNSSEFDIALCMLKLLKQAGVDMLFYADIVEANVHDGRISDLTAFCCGKKLVFSANSFVDATGDAVLSRLAEVDMLSSCNDETMTKTVLFRVSGVKNFDKSALIEAFSELDFPFPWQDRFMGTPICSGNEILLNLSAVQGDALDPFDLTRMDIQLREQIPVIVEWARKKLPGFEDCRLSAVAPVIGVRASCNIKGKETITSRDLDENTPVKEPVAVGKRSYGEHYVRSFNSPWKSKASGKRSVPYGALIPEKISNLSVGGRCISIETKAVSAIRLMPVCMATGQAAGIAAAMDFPDYAKLKEELIKQNCVLTHS